MSVTDTTTKDVLLALDKFFPYQLRRTHVSINACLSAVYDGRHSLSQAEWRVFSIIARDVEITNRGIVTAATIDKVAVSRAVSRLEKKKLVERKPNQEDGRSVLLTLSVTGKSLYAQISAELLKVEATLLRGLDASETEQLINLLKRIEGNAANVS